jgi:cyclase
VTVAERATELAVRVIPCLDVANGEVVKGVRFEHLAALGSPAEAAERYAREGADEIALLDIAASTERRGPALDWVRAVAERVFVPLVVGGGVRALSDARELLLAGADKVAVNSAAVTRPELLTELAERFGRQCVVLSADATLRDGRFELYTHGGRRATGRDALEWIEEGVERGAGELLLTSIDRDGTGDGFDLELLRRAAARVDVPIVASGGAGGAGDFVAALRAGASAVLAAGVFHRGEIEIPALKSEIARAGFEVRR